MLTSSFQINVVTISIMIMSTQHQIHCSQTEKTTTNNPYKKRYSATEHREFRNAAINQSSEGKHCLSQHRQLRRTEIKLPSCQNQTNESESQCFCCLQQCYCCYKPEGLHQQYWLRWYKQNQSHPYAQAWLTQYEQIAQSHNAMICSAIYVKVGPLNFKK